MHSNYLNYFTNQFKNIGNHPHDMPNSSPKSCQIHFPSIPKSYQTHPKLILKMPPSNQKNIPNESQNTFHKHSKYITKLSQKHPKQHPKNIPKTFQTHSKRFKRIPKHTKHIPKHSNVALIRH